MERDGVHGVWRPTPPNGGGSGGGRRYMSCGLTSSTKVRPPCTVKGCPNKVALGSLCCISHGAKMRRRGSGAQEGAPKPRAKQPAAIDTLLVLHRTSRSGDKKGVKKKDAAHRKFPTAAAAGDGTDVSVFSDDATNTVLSGDTTVAYDMPGDLDGDEGDKKGEEEEYFGDAEEDSPDHYYGKAVTADLSSFMPNDDDAGLVDEDQTGDLEAVEEMEEAEDGAAFGIAADDSDADVSYESTSSSPADGSRSSESEDGEDEGSGSDSSSISTTTTSISKRDGSSDLDSDSVAAVKARGSSRRSGRKRSREQVNYNLNAGDEKFEERLQAYQKQMPTRKKRAAATKKIEDIAATSTNIADVDRRQTGNEQRLPFPCTFQSPITAASTPDLSLLPSLGRLPENQSAMYLLQTVSPPIISGTKAATTKGPADPPTADEGNREDDFGAALQAAIMRSPELFP